MAFYAVHGRGLDTDMALLKGVAGGLMAFGAQLLHLHAQQPGCLCRVGLMAALAIPASRGMHLFRGHFFLKNGVTAHAEIRAGGQQQGIKLGLMRIMAGSALCLAHRLVAAQGRCRFIGDRIMAIDTEVFLMAHRNPLIV